MLYHKYEICVKGVYTLKHYVVKVGNHTVYSGVGLMIATDAYEKCMADRTYACSKCKAKQFVVDSDKDLSEELKRMKQEVCCDEARFLYHKDNGHINCECLASAPNGFVTMTCDEK